MFHYVPELPAVIEHLTVRDLPGTGDCRIVNVRTLGGNGRLIIGSARRPNGTSTPHVWGKSPAGERVDVACPTCTLEAVHAILTVSDYTITNVEVVADGPPGLPENTRYLKMAVAIRDLQATLGEHAASLHSQRAPGWGEK